MRFFPRYSFLRFLSPIAVFLFSAVVGVSFAAWLDAPNAPPNYGIVGCTPPCSQDDFKPMNLGGTKQTKYGSATFVGDLTANSFKGTNPTYYVDPDSAASSGNLNGTFTVGGNVGIGETASATHALNVNGTIIANGFFDRQDSAYFIDPKATIASGNLSGTFTVGGNVGIGTTNTSAYALNVAGDANATQLCIAGICKSGWPTTPAETDPKVSGGTTGQLVKWSGVFGVPSTTLGTAAIYNDNSNNISIGDNDTEGYKLKVAGTAKFTGAITGTSATFTGATFSGNVTIGDAGFYAGLYPLLVCANNGSDCIAFKVVYESKGIANGYNECYDYQMCGTGTYVSESNSYPICSGTMSGWYYNKWTKWWPDQFYYYSTLCAYEDNMVMDTW